MMKSSNGKTSQSRTLKISDQLREYFKNTPKEILDKEWKEINEKYPNSPTVEDWIKFNKPILLKSDINYG